MFVVIARIKAKQDHGDELEAIFREMVEWVTENEADTVTYTCNRSTTDRDQFTFFERYTNRKAFEAHTGSEKFAELGGRIQGSLDGPIEIETYDEIAGKL
jgi:quinol monooxygenase YgiN